MIGLYWVTIKNFKNERNKKMAMYQIVVNEEESKKIQAVKDASINAGAVISVFGIHLMGAIENSADGTRVLVCPSTENPKQSVSLDSICDSVGISSTAKESIDSVIKYLGFTHGIKETTIDVYQAFYYYSSYKTDTADGLNQEYAFSLGMTNGGELNPPEGLPFSIESISFSLWNSTREKVVESLGVYSIADMLKKLS